MKKIYLSGKISGLPFEDVFSRFESVEKDFTNRGYSVVNPTKNGVPRDASWSKHMRKDLELLSGCDEIILLPGWEESRGARIEKRFAEKRGIKIIELKNLIYEKKIYA